MQSRLCLAILAVSAVTLSLPAGAQLGVNDEPLTAKWAPSEWGPDDKVGAPNRTTPELVLKAVGLVKKGKTATLGKIYASDAPAFGTRGWKLMIPGRPTGGPFGDQQLVYNDEYITQEELGQIGTQFDGPGHIGVITSKGMFYYNGRFLHDKEIGATELVHSESSTSHKRVSFAAACCSMRWHCAAAHYPCQKKIARPIPAS